MNQGPHMWGGASEGKGWVGVTVWGARDGERGLGLEAQEFGGDGIKSFSRGEVASLEIR
jgi:hypothetical protein